ncbi:hypothetical protein BDZ89DRAFT_1069659 [Hymenopellis radicata]|nr:hypothetical protein BDZ89DRAFT_1069659 [Hymenopellis radicata]
MEPQKRAKCTQNIARGGDDRLEPQRGVARVRERLESISRRLKRSDTPGRRRESAGRERNAARLWLKEEMVHRQSGREFGFLGVENPRRPSIQQSEIARGPLLGSMSKSYARRDSTGSSTRVPAEILRAERFDRVQPAEILRA